VSIKLIADSGSDMPRGYAKENDIDIVPLIVNFEDQEFLDGETIDPIDLYKNMREGTVYKTAQVSIHTFKELFKEYAKRGDQCIYIAFSSELSGTYQAAEMAKSDVLEEYPGFDITIVDSKAASFGYGLIVYYANQMIQRGRSKEDVVQAIQFFSEHMEHVFTVDNLEYLYRGGRVSRTSAFVGGLLNIKPILEVQDGKLVPLEKIRGRKKVLKRMVDIMEERGTDFSNQIIGISHGDDLETAEALREEIQGRFQCKGFMLPLIGAAIGAHAGPGTIALFFLNKEIPEEYR